MKFRENPSQRQAYVLISRQEGQHVYFKNPGERTAGKGWEIISPLAPELFPVGQGLKQHSVQGNLPRTGVSSFHCPA